MSRLRFGTFLAPFHRAGENPTLALQRDLELIELHSSRPRPLVYHFTQVSEASK